MQTVKHAPSSWVFKGVAAIVVALALAFAMVVPAQAGEERYAYGVYDESTQTLTLFYDSPMPDGAYEIYENGGNCGWWEFEINPKTIVFDSSFKDYTPGTLGGWFSGMDNLVEVKGTENLDASWVHSTGLLFEACSSLKTLDLSTWDTPFLGDAFGMFYGCSSLESLNIAKLDTSRTMDLDRLFDGCSSLKSVTLGSKFAFTEGIEPMAEAAPAIFPTPDTEYGTWWRGEGKAYTPDELRGFARGELEGTWTWYTGETPAKATKMYRLYNPNTGEHFYTSNVGERDHTIAAGWTDEGVGWIAPDKSNTPVYRLYNENLGGEHHYTLDANERKVLIAAGWTDEGIGWYSDDEKGAPVYREYNPNQLACNHNFTTDTNEHKTLVALGWTDEGIAWYGMKVLV